ncbi:tetratricopeptide repeat protein [Shewanella sp. UCD-KL12]|uniref:tetratricopeptide repeat protein n=1 Tax=Shewanella sp. UCD-KL12 TaxID=1917163 RepID=UPI0009F9AD20|nr:tetratricopeptide repeat protein [Shewanella sp. UCD-KL12]
MRALFAIVALVSTVPLLGCSTSDSKPSMNDLFCDYAVAGLVDTVSQSCIAQAEQGNSHAAMNLAYLYVKAELIATNPKRATELYHMAASMGEPTAEYALAELYRTGFTGARQPKLAREWYMKAAQQQHEYQKDAQFMLGLMYFEGNGGGKDLSAAEHWLKLSVDNGHGEAAYLLGQINFDEYYNIQRAHSWFQKSAELGHVPANHKLGLMYSDGSMGHTDQQQARLWFLKAAEMGSADSQVNLATLEFNGINGESDLMQCYVWLSAADSQGHEIARERMALLIPMLSESELQQAQGLSQRCIQSQFKDCGESKLRL